MVLNDDNLSLIDDLSPFDRFKLLTNNSNKDCLLILLILFQIDKILKDFFKVTYNFYVMDDLTIKLLFEKITKNGRNKDFKRNLILLEKSGLVYRFTCAKKFKIQNKSLKQLRINSWGKDHVLKKKLLDLFVSRKI